MLSGGRDRCGDGSFQQDRGGDGRRHQRGGGSGSNCSSRGGMAAPDFTFGRFLNRGDIVGFEVLEKQDGGAFLQPLTFWSGLRLLKDDDHFREQFSHLLREAEFDSYFFEMPGVSSGTAYTCPFRFVLVKAPGLLGRDADHRSFQEHFVRGSRDVVSFKNLRGDATLVAPCPTRMRNSDQHFSHLAGFVRHADRNQVSSFWKTVAREAMNELKSRPSGSKLWMSTAGQGVSWLHFRIEDTPKYYSFAEYKNAREPSYY